MGYMYNKRTGDSNVDMFSQLDRIEAMLIQLTTKKKVKPRSAKLEYSQWFSAWWSIYPKRSGANPKRKAESACCARIHDGDTYECLEQGLERYRAYCDATVEDKRYVMQACRFFGPDKFYEESWTIPETIPAGDDEMVRWAAQKGYRKPYQTESYSAYRAAVKSMHRGM